MSLLIAKNIESQIRIISDSKISDINDVIHCMTQGILKVIVINPKICIGFAGSVGIAQLALEIIFNKYEKSECIGDFIEILQFHSTMENNATDFLIASLLNGNELIKIDCGNISRNQNTVWLGNKKAFNEFQRLFHNGPFQQFYDELNKKKAGNGEFMKLTYAFGEIVRLNQYEDIGDFQIMVASKQDGFRYMEVLFAGIIEQTIQGTEWQNVKIGNAATGGFTYSILTPSEPGIGAIGVYFRQGNFGTIFYPKYSSKNIIYKDCSFTQFKEQVKNDFRIILSGNLIGGNT